MICRGTSWHKVELPVLHAVCETGRLVRFYFPLGGGAFREGGWMQVEVDGVPLHGRVEQVDLANWNGQPAIEVLLWCDLCSRPWQLLGAARTTDARTSLTDDELTDSLEEFKRLLAAAAQYEQEADRQMPDG